MEEQNASSIFKFKVWVSELFKLKIPNTEFLYIKLQLLCFMCVFCLCVFEFTFLVSEA
jgi:hypothetical protein